MLLARSVLYRNFMKKYLKSCTIVKERYKFPKERAINSWSNAAGAAVIQKRIKTKGGYNKEYGYNC